MIPLKDNIRHRRPPVATLALIAAGVAAYALLGHERFAAGSVALLAVNSLFLLIFGASVEDSMSTWRYLALYLLAAYGLGAEGAVAVVVGSYTLLYPRARIVTLSIVPLISTVLEAPALAIVALWGVLEIVLIAVAGHVGADAYLQVLGGFLIGMVVVRPVANRVHEGHGQDTSRLPVY